MIYIRPTVHTQEEILQRYITALAERTEAEANEYLRQMTYDTSLRLPGGAGLHKRDVIETNFEITYAAKKYLPFLLHHMSRQLQNSITSSIAQYVAWKWMLGHPDADNFLGAHGTDPRRVCFYIKDQIESGEWDRLTKKSQTRKADHKHYERSKTRIDQARR